MSASEEVRKNLNWLREESKLWTELPPDPKYPGKKIWKTPGGTFAEDIELKNGKRFKQLTRINE